MIDLPLPPLEFRHLVGPTDPAAFDDPSARLNFDRLPPHAYTSVFDFGCGCGRLARQFMLNGKVPVHYVGIDPHRDMIEWCRDNITSRAPQFEFRHHDVFQEFMNPGGTLDQVPLPAADGSVTLFLAWSVFTHLLPPDAEYYLHELARVLSPDGVAITTWFMFDKREFPMMQDFQNALYISDFDPTNAVIVDRTWLEGTIGGAGLSVSVRIEPGVAGYQWTLHLRKTPPPGSKPILPVPPIEYRRLVGRPDERFYNGSVPEPLIADLEEHRYDSVLDFGSGIGRLAGHFMLREPPPKRYLGIDRHQGMIDWCRTFLAPLMPGFEFEHHNVFHPALNPGGTPGHLPLPREDGDVTLFMAISVFTHLLEEHTAFYLRELGRVLAPNGLAITSWFLFDKGDFPMMQEFQNALMINPDDLTNAVIFDREWMLRTANDAGLVMTRAVPPQMRGYHWVIYFERSAPDRANVQFPEDAAPRGISRPPLG